MSSQFYKACWDTVKGDLKVMIIDFHAGTLDIGRLNYGAITLIPKAREAVNVKHFRPICLLNVSFKIFTKLLMERLNPFANKLVD